MVQRNCIDRTFTYYPHFSDAELRRHANKNHNILLS